MSEPLRVLHVCTANICRSPLAEHLMRRGLADRLGADAGAAIVTSAGTRGLAGRPMEPHAASTLAVRGIDGTPFRSRLLTSALVEEADLVLVATRDHRAVAVTLSPRSAARTFTLRELSRLCQGVSATDLPQAALAERGRALAGAAAAQRGLRQPDSPSDDDLSDPYRGPLSAFAITAQLVAAALRLPLDLLTGVVLPPATVPVPQPDPAASPRRSWRQRVGALPGLDRGRAQSLDLDV